MQELNETESPSVLFAGCGDLGIGAAQKLALMGWRVWGLRRDASTLPAPLNPWSADLSQPSSLQPIPTAFTHIVYTATPDRFDESAYRATYVDGLRNLLDALNPLQRASLQRFILVSSTSVYDQREGEWIDETSPAQPSSFSGQCLLEAEQLLPNFQIPYTIVRFGGIYGANRTQALLDRVRRQDISRTDGPPLYTNRIHRDDCVGILVHLLQHPQPDSLYLGVDSDPAPRDELVAWLATELGLPVPPVGTNVPRKRGDSNKRCSNQRLLQSGYTFRYPTYKDGYRAILAASTPSTEGFPKG